MKKIHKSLLAGALALMFAGSAVAHGSGYNNGYYGSGLSGSATIWGNSYGQSGWAGSLNYNSGYAPAPVFVPVAGHVHGPACYGPPRHAYGNRHQRGHHKGRGHYKGHGRGNRHGPHH